MQKWMAFQRNLGTPMSFRLVAATDINAAIEIGEEVANREDAVFVGVATWAERVVEPIK